MFTVDILTSIFPNTPHKVLNQYVEPLNDICERFDISTKARAAAFIAQIGHESAGLTTTKENLNYSTQGLRRVFFKYFKTDAEAAKYARKPEMIASRVYANRMGNGNEASRDGWTYRGRGLLQCTGKNNYAALAKELGKTLDETVVFLETPEGAVTSAAWFWKTNGLNGLADHNRFTDITRRVNGGLNGFEDRKEIWVRARNALIG